MNKIRHMSHSGKGGSIIKKDSTVISSQGGVSGVEKPFDAMNNIVANLLLNITRYLGGYLFPISAPKVLVFSMFFGPNNGQIKGQTSK